jgi:hypothetical protein
MGSRVPERVLELAVLEEVDAVAMQQGMVAPAAPGAGNHHDRPTARQDPQR